MTVTGPIGRAERRRVVVVITGRVQGVGFRWSCRREAERLGVGGWVRNRLDGTVEAAFEGEASAVGAMVAWCRTGPDDAFVSHVVEEDEELEGERSFRIVH